MRIRTFILAASLTTTGLLVLPTTTATAAPARYADDFNGDGYRDLVVAAPSATVSGHEAAGSVVVLYGSSSAPSAAKRKLISQATTGVPGTPETGDRFGESISSADLDLDGYADLVIGAPGEDVDGVANRGTATVIWGSASGLTGGANLPTTHGSNATGCAFGTDVAAVGKTPYPTADVRVAGGCSVWTFRAPVTRTGKPAAKSRRVMGPSAAKLTTGDLDGDSTADEVEISVGLGDLPSGGVYINRSGSAYEPPLSHDGDNAAIGDVNGDGYGDLVVGDSSDTTIDGTPQPGTGHEGGQIAVWLGSASGIDAGTAPLLVNQSTPGVPGASEAGDSFGADVSVTDVDGDGYGDIAVGTPGESLGSAQRAGSVVIVPGSRSGPTGAGAYSITQDTSGVPGTAERTDLFGSTVRLADLTKDGRPELVVGAPGENAPGATRDTGGIWSFKGTSTGPSTAASSSIMAGSVGLPTSSDTNWAEAVLAP
ncbi:FG-GAP repeat protein [Streptomyces sp. NPDC050658]|uniref:FG-GAP repeat protein n=1 Tax=unclassified Streptomyces TaxID=2593676 RepID=UPI00341B6FE7